MPSPMEIAIDGPVAAGKTAVGRLVAERLGCRFLDTGMMYRALTHVALRRGVDLEDEGGLVDLAERLTIRLAPETGVDRLTVDGEDMTDHLRRPEVERGVSLVSRVPGVRRALVGQQRTIAKAGPVVMAGRDIGTVVLPEAGVKVYLTASVEERARRRFLELKQDGETAECGRVLSELRRRDKIDSERDDSPLRPAEDAVMLDTDGIEIEDLARQIVSYVSLR